MQKNPPPLSGLPAMDADMGLQFQAYGKKLLFHNEERGM